MHILYDCLDFVPNVNGRITINRKALRFQLRESLVALLVFLNLFISQSAMIFDCLANWLRYYLLPIRNLLVNIGQKAERLEVLEILRKANDLQEAIAAIEHRKDG